MLKSPDFDGEQKPKPYLMPLTASVTLDNLATLLTSFFIGKLNETSVRVFWSGW